MNTFKNLLYNHLDKLFEKSQNIPLTFVDAYQDNRTLGACGAFLEETIPNSAVMYSRKMFYDNYSLDKNYIVFCQLVNSNNKTNIYTKEDTLKTFFGIGYDAPCTVIFFNVPYQHEQKIFIQDIVDYVCDYNKKAR
jgi:hypothetical protein